jgi:hypothetical protein
MALKGIVPKPNLILGLQQGEERKGKIKVVFYPTY